MRGQFFILASILLFLASISLLYLSTNFDLEDLSGFDFGVFQHKLNIDNYKINCQFYDINSCDLSKEFFDCGVNVSVKYSSKNYDAIYSYNTARLNSSFYLLYPESFSRMNEIYIEYKNNASVIIGNRTYPAHNNGTGIIFRPLLYRKPYLAFIIDKDKNSERIPDVFIYEDSTVNLEIIKENISENNMSSVVGSNKYLEEIDQIPRLLIFTDQIPRTYYDLVLKALKEGSIVLSYGGLYDISDLDKFEYNASNTSLFPISMNLSCEYCLNDKFYEIYFGNKSCSCLGARAMYEGILIESASKEVFTSRFREIFDFIKFRFLNDSKIHIYSCSS